MSLLSGFELACSYRTNPQLPGALNMEQLRVLQLDRLNTTVAHARMHSRFYCKHFDACTAAPLTSLDELAHLPLSDATIFQQGIEALLCVSPNEVSRIVTLPTSGATGEPKRVAFTAADQQFTLDYFAAGMRMLAKAGETIAVLFPCERPGGLGALLLAACEQANIVPLAAGIPTSFATLAVDFQHKRVRGVVGFPQHIFAFARWCAYHDIKLEITGVLLSADNVAAVLRREISAIWNCEVFEHFGMTESGYGAAVDCHCHRGLHLRETDLIAEIIDPDTTRTCPSGEWGELVITTLSREAMPLIRYRTGDHTRFLPGPCPCGSILQRIDTVRPRVAERVSLGMSGQKATVVTMANLEEMFFALPGVIDFKAEYDNPTHELTVTIQMITKTKGSQRRCQQPPLGKTHPRQLFPGITTLIEHSEDFYPYYSAKRTIIRIP